MDWRRLFGKPGFPYLFAAMFVSLFGTGLNFAGTTWYVLDRTQSTVAASLITVLVTLPGLVVPPFGGVLIDRVDRRYLSIALDLLRGVVVLSAAALLIFGHAEVWHIYAMVLLLGAGFSIYWSTTHALLQEVIGIRELVAANAAVLIAVQGGMMTAGALVGFVYRHIHLGGVLTIDGLTYFLSAVCLMKLRKGYVAPHHNPELAEVEAQPTELTEEAAWPPSTGEEALLMTAEPEAARGFFHELKEGLHYLRGQPRVFALGLTYACMMAGVLSANVLVAALCMLLLHAGPEGFGYMESGWALGAIVGGLTTGFLVRRFRPTSVVLVALGILAVGHALFPYARWLLLAVAMHAIFGACRALGGVLTQSSIMTTVPRRLMGRTQSAFSVIATVMQVIMSFSLGTLAQHASLKWAFLVLGMLYGVAFLAGARAVAVHAREP
ncbi:MAG TPA: MFS transporter [Candidatus Acidoferrales bacterium]|nr:MFS transporter [Candidatus Acidoferrales bacterium]